MDKTTSTVRDIQPGPLAPRPAPAAPRPRRLALGSLHGELRATPTAEPVAGWRAAIFIGGAVTLPAAGAIAGLVLLARRAGPLSAELSARAWPLLLPLALLLTSWSALLALRHARARLSDGVPVEPLAGSDDG